MSDDVRKNVPSLRAVCITVQFARVSIGTAPLCECFERAQNWTVILCYSDNNSPTDWSSHYRRASNSLSPRAVI